jgi:hypothetical protein
MGSLEKNADNSFSCFPKIGYNNKNLKEPVNGVYANFYSKEIYAFFNGEATKIFINPLAKKEKIIERDIIEQLEYYGKVLGDETKDWIMEKKNKFATAALCCFHPDYARIDNEKNDLELILEMRHNMAPNGFIIESKNMIRQAPKSQKIGILKYL